MSAVAVIPSVELTVDRDGVPEMSPPAAGAAGAPSVYTDEWSEEAIFLAELRVGVSLGT